MSKVLERVREVMGDPEVVNYTVTMSRKDMVELLNAERTERRFQAAVAAMQGLLAEGGDEAWRCDEDQMAATAVAYGDALLAALDADGGGK